MCSPYSQHQNGTVERNCRSHYDITRCLLIQSNLPKTLRTYALKISTCMHLKSLHKKYENTFSCIYKSGTKYKESA